MAFFKKKKKEKDVDDFLIEMITSWKEVYKAAQEATEDEKKARLELNQVDRQISELQVYAAKAVQAGNEDDARRFLASKKSQTEIRERVFQSYQTKTEHGQKLRKMSDDLVDQIEDMRARKAAIQKTKDEAAAQELLNKMNEMARKHEATAKESLASMEEEAAMEKAKAEAKAELTKAEKESGMDALLAKYDNMELNAREPSIDDDLEALQSKYGV